MRGEHKISGQLAGEYELLLASHSTTAPFRKRLKHVLVVGLDNSYSSHFRVEVNGETVKYHSLAQAIRYYEDQ